MGGPECKDCTDVKLLRSQFDDLKKENKEEHSEIKMTLKEVGTTLQEHAIKIGQGKMAMAILAALGAIIGSYLSKLF